MLEGFTIVDAIAALVIIVSALLAYSRGFVREMLAILGWIAAAILAFIFAARVKPLIHQIPIVSDFIGESCELAMIVAFAAVFAIALVIFAIFTPLFSSLVQRSILGGLDQGLGFIFGVLRGILLVAVAFFVYNTMLTAQEIPMVDNSRAAQVFGGLTNRVEDQDPEAALGWITRQYEQLIGECVDTE